MCCTSAWSLAFACLGTGDDSVFVAWGLRGRDRTLGKEFVACFFALLFRVEKTTISFSLHGGTQKKGGRTGTSFFFCRFSFLPAGAAVMNMFSLHGAPRKGLDWVSFT